MNKSYRILCIAIGVFALFSPVIFGELITVDDLDVHAWIVESDLSPKGFFLPGGGKGAYYRPFIGLSYLVDKYVWLHDTRFMHLDNILFHVANVFLIYWLTSLLVPSRKSGNFLPLTAALVFGVHPITTESVNWLSGRTDVIACTFVLLSTISLVKFKESRSPVHLLACMVMLLCGVLTKESSLGFVIGALFIFLATPTEEPTDVVAGNRRSLRRELQVLALMAVLSVMVLIVSYQVWPVFLLGILYVVAMEYADARESGSVMMKLQGFRILLISTAAVAMAGALFAVMRRMVFTSSISSISQTITLIFQDLNYACQVFLGAAGFYVKKFFLPLPLNFAIREIDPFYNLLGVLVFFVCLFLIRRKTIPAAMFLSGVCMFILALPFALGTIAWTSYAERYMYMSTAFWTVTLAVLAAGLPQMTGGKYVAWVTAVLVLLMAGITFQRNLTWRSNLALYEDTVKKSPTFKTVRAEYMVALMGRGRYADAKEQYRIYQSIPSIGYNEAVDLNMAALLAVEGRNNEAVSLYENIIRKTKGESAVAYGKFAEYLQGRLIDSKSMEMNNSYAIRLIDCYEKLFQLKKDPAILYTMGQVALAAGQKEKALLAFRRAERAFPSGNQFKKFSGMLVERLE